MTDIFTIQQLRLGVHKVVLISWIKLKEDIKLSSTSNVLAK